MQHPHGCREILLEQGRDIAVQIIAAHPFGYNAVVSIENKHIGHYIGFVNFLNVFALPEVEQQFHQLVGYMKSEPDTCYLTITPEEAMKIGFSKEAYEKALRETQIRTRNKKGINQNSNDSTRTGETSVMEPHAVSGE